MTSTAPTVPPVGANHISATAPPESETAASLQNSITPSALSFSRARRGNVARLPKTLRDKINHMLDDGLSYAQIVRELGPDGKGLVPAHIGSWKTGGYQDYLREQQRLESCRISHDFLPAFLTNCQGTESYLAAPKLAASLLCETFVDLGPETIRRALKENPMNAFRLLNALARILSGGLRCERFLAQKARSEAGGTAPDQKKGLTPKTFDQINDELHLM